MHVYVRRIILDLHHEWSLNKPFASYGVEGITILNLVGLQTSLLQIVNDTMHREHPAKWCTDCNWTSPIIIRTITNFCCLRNNLVYCWHDEISKLHFSDWTHTIHSSHQLLPQQLQILQAVHQAHDLHQIDHTNRVSL